MLFCLQWEIGLSRMKQVFPSYRFTELGLFSCLYPSGSNAKFLNSQFQSQLNLSMYNVETFPFSTTASVTSV